MVHCNVAANANGNLSLAVGDDFQTGVDEVVVGASCKRIVNFSRSLPQNGLHSCAARGGAMRECGHTGAQTPHQWHLLVRWCGGEVVVLERWKFELRQQRASSSKLTRCLTSVDIG